MRNKQVQKYYDDTSHSDNDIFVFFAGYNVVLILIAGILTVCAGSSAAGDGVAEVKAWARRQLELLKPLCFFTWRASRGV